MDLTFDEMCVDTILAEEYIKRKEVAEFISSDGQSYLYYDGKTIENIKKDRPRQVATSENNLVDKLKCLANLFKTNIALFAQLEYFFRKIPIDGTETQINLLIQSIYWFISKRDTVSLNDKKVIQLNNSEITMFEDPYESPLLMFINIIGKIHVLNLEIKAFRETAAVCCLLVQLFCRAGFDSIIVKREPSYFFKGGPFLMRGTLGVVTDDADVDSAVDVFISSTRKVPWELRRILVQENVYEQFKDALRWKCNLKNTPENVITPKVKCAKVMCYKDRSFVIDPLENVDDPCVVTIEAYRTTKELLSLANSYDPYSMSLWANGVEHINEISYGVDCLLIWVNNFGDFRRPLEICETIFYKDSQMMKNNEHLKQKARNWAKLGDLKRYEIINNFTNDEDLLKDPGIDFKGLLNYALTRRDYNKQSFVHVDNDFVCTGFDQLVGIRFFPRLHNYETLRSLLRGNTVVLIAYRDTAIMSLVEKYGLPVECDTCADYYNELEYYGSDYVKKVIWTNKGTVFAN